MLPLILNMFIVFPNILSMVKAVNKQRVEIPEAMEVVGRLAIRMIKTNKMSKDKAPRDAHASKALQAVEEEAILAQDTPPIRNRAASRRWSPRVAQGGARIR